MISRVDLAVKKPRQKSLPTGLLWVVFWVLPLLAWGLWVVFWVLPFRVVLVVCSLSVVAHAVEPCWEPVDDVLWLCAVPSVTVAPLVADIL